MAQTVQSSAMGGPSGSKRKGPPNPDPNSPSAVKKKKTGTARKSTGGRAPRKTVGGGSGPDANVNNAGARRSMSVFTNRPSVF